MKTKKVFLILKNVAIGTALSIIILAIGLTSLEILVRKIKPQITYEEALAMSRGYWRPSNFAPFTWKPHLHYGAFTTNSLGYHSDEFTTEKPPGVYRILVVGDSFVEGADDYHLAWPYVIQSLLRANNRKVEVINAGFYGGYSPDSYYAYLKTEGLSLKPDLIVLGLYFQNDIADLKPNHWIRTDENGLPLQVVSDWRKIDAQGRQWDGVIPLRYHYPYINNSHLWILLANWLDRKAPFLFHPKDEAKQLQDNNYWNYLTFTSCIYKSDCLPQFKDEFDKVLFVLGGTAKLLKSQNTPLLIVFETSKWQAKLMGDDSLSDEDIFRLQGLTTDYFQKNNLPAQFLDLTPEILAGNPKDYYLETDTHWNSRGNQLAGELVTTKIQDIMSK